MLNYTLINKSPGLRIRRCKSVASSALWVGYSTGRSPARKNDKRGIFGLNPMPVPGGSSPCASCKLLRRRCARDCIFAPYFPPDEPYKFAIVHKVFGASNISKMLQELPVHQRADAVSSLVYEANARLRDPVYGCVGAISYLQNQVSELQLQLAVAQAEILSMQMQQEPSCGLSPQCGTHGRQGQIDQKWSLLLSSAGLSSLDLSHYLGFASGGVVQDPPCIIKDERDPLWT